MTLSAEVGLGEETSKRSAVSQAEAGPYPPSSSERPESSGTASVGCFLLEEHASAGTCMKGQAPVSEPVWPLAGKQKGLGSFPLRLSLLFKKVVVCGHCLVTLSLSINET